MVNRLLRTIISNGADYTLYAHSLFDGTVKDDIGLYLHIPFCNSMCPYCPYYKVAYDAKINKAFKEAVILEIDRYARKYGRRRFTSLYIGGGTPTLVIDELRQIVDRVHTFFELSGYIAMETTPADLTAGKIRLLKAMGVTYISLGVQSFQNKYLCLLGRKYDAETAARTAGRLCHDGFTNYNIDLIFAIPGETMRDLESDLRAAVKCGADQITCYPLFTFPYSSIGQFTKLRRLRMPPLDVRRKMYYFIHDFLAANGYARSSVWSFTRAGKAPYSSVTREYYVGFGPSAGSYTGDGFFFNTFSVVDYMKTVLLREPVALKMDVTERMRKIFWLYWRLYETVIPYAEYRAVFGGDIDDDFGVLLDAVRGLGMCHRENGESMVLNKRGCYWIHLAQNYFALNYVNKIWSACQSDPWPRRIKL